MIPLTVLTIVGAVCIFLGMENRKGNIESLHSYHKHWVVEADKQPFGKMVELGTIIIGIAVIVIGVFLLVTELTHMEIYALIGLAAGLGISFYAMIKYNKGIF